VGVEAGNWTTLLGPANLDKDVVENLNKLIVKILVSTEVRDRLFGLGFEIIASTPKEIGRAHRSGHHPVDRGRKTESS
jgi:tripartite-type tricarboxylate transporter receptor subunit TctC